MAHLPHARVPKPVNSKNSLYRTPGVSFEAVLSYVLCEYIMKQLYGLGLVGECVSVL